MQPEYYSNLGAMQHLPRKQHWENIYQNRPHEEVSWYQQTPAISLDFIKNSKLPKKARIIDIGGGESFLVDHLLEEGYKNITVLDISDSAIRHARQRVGDQAKNVEWIVSDIVDFQPEVKYDFWHDRATFHFLTGEDEIKKYMALVNRAVRPGGYAAIATFSDVGPQRCSGLEIHQYSENSLTSQFADGFQVIECRREDHLTPFNTIQNFLFCFFRRRGRH